MNLTDPQSAEALRRHREQLTWQKMLRYDRRMENLYEPRIQGL
jgi:hypothetical protein